MKKVLNILKIVLLLVVIVFMYGFSKSRNKARTLKSVDIHFVDGNTPLLTYQTVNNLLIQKDSAVNTIVKETIDLKEMEKRLLENPMIRNAEVFVSVDGVLGAKIEQREPIGRIRSDRGENYYLDAQGTQMPLSAVYSARVPLISGVSEDDYEMLRDLILKINEDEFMKKIVIGINKNQKNELEFDLRSTHLKALVGKPRNFEKKFQNFKAFYKKTQQDSTINRYAAVNLKYDKQVIAIKK